MGEKEAQIEALVQNIVTRLRRRQVKGSFNVAAEIVTLLRNVVSIAKWNTAKDLMDLLRRVGRRVQAAQPNEVAIGNMVRRVLNIIREEYAEEPADEFGTSSTEAAPSREQLKSLKTLVTKNLDKAEGYKEVKHHLKVAVIEAINELRLELENSRHSIVQHAQDMIHANEIILVYGRSSTVEAFLKHAHKKHSAKQISFNVIVVEAAPGLHGHDLALSLAQDGLPTTVIPDSAVFAIMSRVNKVIIGTHGIMADGGLMAQSGTYNVALAAKHYSVPVIVCCALYKLTTRFPCTYDKDEFADLASPHDTLDFSEAGCMANVEVRSPIYDYVPPQLISLYITNGGGHAPTYLYRLLSEYYHPDDVTL